MTLRHPVCITSRLLPGLKVGDSYVSIEFGTMTAEGRIRYRYFIDGPDGKELHQSDDLKSGVGGGSLLEGLEALLSFMTAAAEAVRWHQAGNESENSELFPPWVMGWCYLHQQELEYLALELDKTPNAITV